MKARLAVCSLTPTGLLKMQLEFEGQLVRFSRIYQSCLACKYFHIPLEHEAQLLLNLSDGVTTARWSLGREESLRFPSRSCVATVVLSGSRIIPLKSRRTIRGTGGARLPGITGEATPAASLKTNDTSSPGLPGRSPVSLMEPRRSLSRNVEKSSLFILRR